MNIDLNQVEQQLSEFHKHVQGREHKDIQLRAKLASLAEGAVRVFRQEKDIADERRKWNVLRIYLNIFINGSTANVFKMGRLPNNTNARRTKILNLYEVVDPLPTYPLVMLALEGAMSKLPYDLDLSDDPSYLKVVDGLLNNRQPVRECGEFGSLPQFLSREGSFWLQPQRDGQYVVDLSRYAQYAVREDIRPYGGRAVVDEQFNVVSVNGIGADDKRFGVELSVFKSTLVLDIILHTHAILSHLLVSQKLYMASSTEYFDKIDADPILRDLYYLCTYRTNDINSNIPILAGNQGSLIQLGFGFKSHSFLQMVTDLISDQTLQNPSDIKDYLITSRSAQWKRIAEPVYAVVDKFVERTVANKLNDEFKLQTKVSLFVSTFFHEMVGDYQLRTIYNCDLNSRTYTGDHYDRKTNEFAYIIAAATIGVSVRILKLHELVKGTYISGESLAAWTELYEGFKTALKDSPWINVDNFEFSVGY